MKITLQRLAQRVAAVNANPSFICGRNIRQGGTDAGPKEAGKEVSMSIRDKLMRQNDGGALLFVEGFDEAIIGVGISSDSGRVVYDARKMTRILSQKENTTREEAWEYLELNTFDAWADNPLAPIYVTQRDYWTLEKG